MGLMRGETAVEMMKFGAYGADFSNPDTDYSKPEIADVEVAFDPVMQDQISASPAVSLLHVWFEVTAYTDEKAQLLLRIEGRRNTVTGEAKDTEFVRKHTLKVDLMHLNILGESAKIEIWAADASENTGHYGPFSLQIPDADAFKRASVRRRLQGTNVSATNEDVATVVRRPSFSSLDSFKSMPSLKDQKGLDDPETLVV